MVTDLTPRELISYVAQYGFKHTEKQLGSFLNDLLNQTEKEPYRTILYDLISMYHEGRVNPHWVHVYRCGKDQFKRIHEILNKGGETKYICYTPLKENMGAKIKY
jgi:hypothetical protein